jgi:purine-nucleoside phosphorylase
MSTLQEINNTAEFLKSKGIPSGCVGIILGTGLGNLIHEITIELEISYEEIPGFPVSTVEFHKGKLIYGTLRGRRVLAMNGRFHYYEGYAMDQVAFPVRVMKQLGIEILLISNAAGAMNLNWKKGDLMLINDHINLLPSNPLIGKNIDELGPRFPDMSEAYDKKFLEKMSQLAQQLNILLRSGVYVAVPGSMLETPAEYRFLRRIGADAVGMSTVPEVIVARHMGMRVLAISVLTDECDPDNLKPVDITEIIAVAGKAEQKLSTLFSAFVENLDATTSIN